MHLGLSERSVVALNFLLIVACAYFAALSVDRIIDARLLVMPAPAANEVERLPVALTRSAYDLIVQRDIFDPYKPPPVVAAAPVSLDLHLTLLGTSLLTKSKPYAIVENQNTHEQNVYKLDDTIPDAGRLIKVEKAKVLIDHDGQVVTLEIPSNGLAPTQPSYTTPRFVARTFGRPGPSDVHAVGRNQFVIDKSAVQRNLQNLGQVFTEMRALPNLAGGQTDGFRLSEIQSGSIFQQMGLQDGDVVTSVNGQALNDPTQAIALFNTLRDSTDINLTVNRGGQTMELNYNIR